MDAGSVCGHGLPDHMVPGQGPHPMLCLPANRLPLQQTILNVSEFYGIGRRGAGRKPLCDTSFHCVTPRC